MALVLGLNVGDVVDIADYWIAVLSVDSRKTATLIAKDGDKIAVSSNHETELAPDVWVQLGPWISMKHVKLAEVGFHYTSPTREDLNSLLRFESSDPGSDLHLAKSL